MDQSYIEIGNECDIVAARQLGRSIAKELGFGMVDQARITTVISELARNIFIYAGEGKIIVRRIYEHERKGIAIISSDEGPGILDICRALEEGFSTSGGFGAGLPGIKRMMDTFDIDSLPGKGTTICVMKWLQ